MANLSMTTADNLHNICLHFTRSTSASHIGSLTEAMGSVARARKSHDDYQKCVRDGTTVYRCSDNSLYVLTKPAFSTLQLQPEIVREPTTCHSLHVPIASKPTVWIATGLFLSRQETSSQSIDNRISSNSFVYCIYSLTFTAKI